MRYELSEIDQAADKLLQDWEKFSVWCFKGEMGAGKTTLIRSVCKSLKIHEGVSSPSFAIINEYQSEDGLDVYHFDFYRLEDEKEAANAGVIEYFDSGEFCLIEWPEKVEGLLPDQYLEINIKLVGQNQRELRITPHGGEN